MKKFLIIFIGIAFIGALAACSNGNQPNQQKSNDTNNNQNNKVTQDLKKYSQDPDKDTDQDFDLIGKLVQEDDDQITLAIKGKEVQIPKSTSFTINEEDSQKSLNNQLVKVEVGSKSQQAEEMELTAQAKANDDGVYEQDSDETKIIGTLTKETKQDLTIKVKSGERTYTKAADFEKDVKGAPKDLKGKTVRIELQNDGKVERLEYNPEDQNIE